MNTLVPDISNTLLEITRKKFKGSYRNIQEVKSFWHNMIYLIFTCVHCKLLKNKVNGISMRYFVSIGLIPPYLLQFSKENSVLLSSEIDEIADRILSADYNLSALREGFLGVELSVSINEITIVKGKNSRDMTGAYYTPYDLAESIVSQALSLPASKLLLKKKEHKIRIADLSCGSGEFLRAAQEYLSNEYSIPYATSALYLWGIDVDPIALQLAICDLLMNAEVSDWKEIVSHFRLGNPLMSSDCEGDFNEKNRLFALNRIYASEMGINFDTSDEKLEFDIIFGNPPWEKIRFEERKFFSAYKPAITALSKKDERTKAIKQMEADWQELFSWYSDIAVDYSKICKGIFTHPYIAHSISGELNTYTMFTELAYNLLSANGLCSLIVKSTLATTPAYKGLWNSLLKAKAIQSLYLFENTQRIFNIDSRERFAVITLSKIKNNGFLFSAGLRCVNNLQCRKSVLVDMNAVKKINPQTGMLPNISRTDDLKVLLKAHDRLPLFDEVYPNCHFGRLIHLTAHSKFISENESDGRLPIYEGKFLEQYDARFSTFKGVPYSKRYAAKASAVKNIEINTQGKPMPESRFFVDKTLWDKYVASYRQPFSLCWRSLTSPTNARTMIAMILPTCPTCQSIQLLQTNDTTDLIMLLALFNSIPFDFFVRLKMPGIDLTQSVIKQIPVPPKEAYEQLVSFNEREATLKIHILSYAFQLLRKESMLAALSDSIKDMVYTFDEQLDVNEARKRLDRLFALAYAIDDSDYTEILKTFPQY